MSIVRNIFVLGLIACVGYSGYVIYLKHYSGVAQSSEAAGLDEAPLFSPDSFPTLGSNAKPKAPTIVLSTSAAPEAPTVSLPNPAETSPVGGSRFSSTAPITAPPLTSGPILPVVAATAAVATPQLLAEAEQALADGKSLRAYRALSLAVQRDDLSPEARTQAFSQLEPLADKIVFAPHKHLALPAVTIKSGMTLEQIATEHQIPTSLLRTVNGLEADQQPELGDALKVIDGPLTLRLQAERKELTLWAGEGFARRFEWNELPAKLQNGPSTIIRNVTAESTTLTLGEIAIYNSAAETTSDTWKQLAAWLDAETTMLVSGVPKASIEEIVTQPVADAKVVSAEMPAAEPMLPEAEASPGALAPLDALRVEVFSPSKPITVGAGANFGLRIINLSDKPAPDVSANIFFSEGLEPVKVGGAEGRLAAGQAVFRPLTIAPRGHVDLQVLATVNDYGRQIYRVEVRCEAWETDLVSEVAVSTLSIAPEPPKLELTEKPLEPSQR